MYFDLIKIEPVHHSMQKKNKPKWSVVHYELDHDREPEQFPPHSLGFWHFDRELGVEQAFARLKHDMIDRRQKLVLELLTEINELNNLEYKEKK
jgi:hypothetical protein